MQSDLLDRDATCRFFGGTRPINPATLYRGVRKGRYPKPVKVGPGSSRWREAALSASHLLQLILYRYDPLLNGVG
jgi:predicted DNA-binding transcriptional regulator AlpA